MGSKLISLLETPNKDNYQQLIVSVISFIRRVNQRGETDTVSMFYSETVKLSYILFQSHF
jgi:hypothetical protein